MAVPGPLDVVGKLPAQHPRDIHSRPERRQFHLLTSASDVLEHDLVPEWQCWSAPDGLGLLGSLEDDIAVRLDVGHPKGILLYHRILLAQQLLRLCVSGGALVSR